MVVQVLFDQNMLLHDCLLGWLDFSTPFLFILLHEERGIIFFQHKSLSTHFDQPYNEKLSKNLNLGLKLRPHFVLLTQTVFKPRS